MKKRTITCIVFLAAMVNTIGQTTLTIGLTPVSCDTVYSGLDVPWELLYGPDGQLWITEREGMVSRINPATKTRQVILNIQSTVFAKDESGLLGMALHPDFVTTPEVFVVYTYDTLPNVKERLVKYQYNGSQLITPQVLLDNIPATNAHDGSRLLFLPDKTLLMTTGDAHIASAPQAAGALNGKVLRLNTDGSIPSNNPFPGSYTYSFGHRNAQGLAMSPWGTPYLTEHGTATNDEFQQLEAGRNYGWPDIEGFCDLPAEISFCAANHVKEPILVWSPSIAPSDLVYYENNSFPEFDRRFLMTTLKNKQLVAIQLDPTGATLAGQLGYLTNQFGRLRDICVGPHQEVYLATNGANAFNTDPGTHAIIRLTPPTPTVSVSGHVPNDCCGIYPTLCHDEVVIESPPDAQLTVDVTDVCGKICLHEKLVQARYRLVLTTLVSGMYFVNVCHEGAIAYTRKIIKE